MAWKVAFSLAILAAPVAAQNIDAAPTYAQIKSMPVPVTDGDITDHPYRVVGHVAAKVKKVTFSGPPSHDKVHKELWERGKKLGADAVIKATYTEPRQELFSNDARDARGVAVKFLSEEEAATWRASQR